MTETSFSGKLRGSEILTAISAAALFISTFFAWFELPSVDELKSIAPGAILQGGGSSEGISLNVWDLQFARWFIYLAILTAAWMVLAAVFSQNVEWSIILATPTVVFSGIAMLSLIYRAFSDPRATATPTTTFYIALASSITLFGAACWAIRDESVPPGFRKAPNPEVVNIDTGT